MKYYIIAGEASGDLHGSNLMKSILKLDNQADFRFWGGQKMLDVGGHLVEHYKNMAFMGFLEVILNLSTIITFIKKCKSDILSFFPTVVILIDYPGFNIRIAKWAKSHGLKVVYYITPQVWAWHKSRVFDLGKYTDKLLVILPFESDFFKKYGVESAFVGHPLLDAVDEYKSSAKAGNILGLKKPILALLPGSRRQEISLMLPIMLTSVHKLQMTIVVACSPAVEDGFYTKLIVKHSPESHIILVKDKTYDLLSTADMALVSSGTATLEAALFGVPQIVCYKGNAVSYFIAKKLIDLKYISLVNLIAGKEIVKELIQYDLTENNIKKELDLLKKNKEIIQSEYVALKEKLGNSGASDRAAFEINQLMKTK